MKRLLAVLFAISPLYAPDIQEIQNLVIIGGGVAGLSGAMYAARGGFEPLVVDEHMGGMLTNAGPLENWPGEISILGPDLMKKIQAHAAYYGARFLEEKVIAVDFSQQPFTLKTNKGTVLKSYCVIVTAGSVMRTINCPGEKEYEGKGIVVCTLCDGPKYVNRPIVIYGSGDSAMARALFMLQYTKNITLVYRSSDLEGSAYLRKKVKTNSDIKLMAGTEVTEILGDGSRLTGLRIRDVATKKVSSLRTDAFFLSIGIKASTELFKDKLQLTPDGKIKVFGYTQTSVEGVFVAGNIASHGYTPALTAAGTGCMAAYDAEDYLIDLLGKERIVHPQCNPTHNVGAVLW